jgi:signal transduction histidine kinase
VKRREAVFALGTAAVLVLALLSVFALELANTQAKSRRDVQGRVHERTVLAVALIDSLLQSVQQQVPQDARLFGGRTVTAAALDRSASRDTYLAVLNSSGRVLAASSRFDRQARADLAASAALRLIRTGHPYGLGDVLPYRRTGVIDFAVAFPTRFGKRILVTGFAPATLSMFITGELRKIPGVKGAHSYLIDGRNTVIASTNPTIPVGHVFNTPAQIKALSRAAGDVGGHYYDQVGLSNSTARIVLSAPDGPLFASVSGLRQVVPWLIFAAFALVAVAALGLGRRALRSADQVRETNARLEAVNAELASTNGALERRAAELARSNAELDQFASIASHDLQEPLRKVRTFTEQVTKMESERLSDKGRDYLERANTAAERMQQLIEDLLKFSRVATHGRPFAAVDLGVLTRAVIDDLEAQVHEAQATVTVGRLPTVSGDAPQLRQLMQNLISNALKFRSVDAPAEIAIRGELVDGSVVLTVRDNGIGFDPQYSGRIFRVFERLHGRSAYPGTGIGLALCRKIAERHGGTIVADAEPGVGATFTVTMPLHQQQEVVNVEHTPHTDAAANDAEPLPDETYARI